MLLVNVNAMPFPRPTSKKPEPINYRAPLILSGCVLAWSAIYGLRLVFTDFWPRLVPKPVPFDPRDPERIAWETAKEEEEHRKKLNLETNLSSLPTKYYREWDKGIQMRDFTK